MKGNYIIVSDFAFQKTRIITQKEHDDHMDKIDNRYKMKWHHVHSKNTSFEKILSTITIYYDYRITCFLSTQEAKIWIAKCRTQRQESIVEKFEILDRTKGWLFPQGTYDSYRGEIKKTYNWLQKQHKKYPELFI